MINKKSEAKAGGGSGVTSATNRFFFIDAFPERMFDNSYSSFHKMCIGMLLGYGICSGFGLLYSTL